MGDAAAGQDRQAGQADGQDAQATDSGGTAAGQDSQAGQADGPEAQATDSGGTAGGPAAGQDGQDGQHVTPSEFGVRYDVPLITQPDGTTCWAAALAMIQSYRDQASYSVDYFAGPAPHGWMKWSQIEPIALNLGFTELAPADLLPAGWRDLLAAHGPLWIVVKSAVSNATSHAVVLTGISGDGSMQGTQMTANNPAGTVDVLSYTDFTGRWDFGAVAGASIFAVQ